MDSGGQAADKAAARPDTACAHLGRELGAGAGERLQLLGHSVENKHVYAILVGIQTVFNGSIIAQTVCISFSVRHAARNAVISTVIGALTLLI